MIKKIKQYIFLLGIIILCLIFFKNSTLYNIEPLYVKESVKMREPQYTLDKQREAEANKRHEVKNIMRKTQNYDHSGYNNIN